MANIINMIAGLFETFAFEPITVTNQATKLTESTFTTLTSEGKTEKAKRAILTIESGQLRYRMDGTNPTSSVGHLLNPFDVLIIIGNQNMLNFRAIRVTDTNSKISASYEK